MGFPRKRLNSSDWRTIQDCVSNSDLPNERRQDLLDKIETAGLAALAAEEAAKK